jgi:hypothetical protein
LPRPPPATWGTDLTEENWPAVGAAVKDYIEAQLERIAFAAEMQADLAALPTTDEPGPVHLPEFGGSARRPFGFDAPV